MNDLSSWIFGGGFIQTIRPDVIWMFSTGNLLPYCIMVFIIIFLVIYGIARKFFIKKSFTTKNYFIMIFLSLLIYYFLWVIIFNIFALSMGIISQNL